MSAVTVGIIDPFHPRTLEVLRQALPQSWRLSVAASSSIVDRIAAFKEAELGFVMAAPVPGELIAAASKLRFIQKLGAGVDKIDMAACEARGISVARLHAGNAIPVAEHTLMLMLAACRRLPLLDRRTRAGEWDKEDSRGVNRQLAGKTIGIVGFGAVGRAVATLLTGFGTKVLYYDPYPTPPEVETSLGVARADLETLITHCDVLTLHLPLTPETKGLIDAKRLASMKEDSILINTARGPLVDEAALAKALRDGPLGAAGIDAFVEEPPVNSPLLALENVVLTPHAAGATIDNFAAVAARAVANGERVLAGEALPPDDVVLAPAALSRAS